ncbi:MAG: septum formation initiator family protein [Rhodobiaceae bacterium]|nr:septum formation initiator family protein [Rhodobiaceae bacterium]
MPHKQVRSERRRYFAWLSAIIVTAYFSYHAFVGGYGLLSMRDLEAQNALLNAKLEALHAQESDLEHRVSLLRPESIDPDMLDERARALLNQAHPSEIILTVKPQAK